VKTLTSYYIHNYGTLVVQQETANKIQSSKFHFVVSLPAE